MGAKNWIWMGLGACAVAGCIAPQKIKGMGTNAFSPKMQDALKEVNSPEGGAALAGMPPTEFDRAQLDQWQSQMTSKMQQMALNESAPTASAPSQPSQAESSSAPAVQTPPSVAPTAAPCPVNAPIPRTYAGPTESDSGPASYPMPEGPTPRIPQSPM